MGVVAMPTVRKVIHNHYYHNSGEFEWRTFIFMYCVIKVKEYYYYTCIFHCPFGQVINREAISRDLLLTMEVPNSRWAAVRWVCLPNCVPVWCLYVFFVSLQGGVCVLTM